MQGLRKCLHWLYGGAAIRRAQYGPGYSSRFQSRNSKIYNRVPGWHHRSIHQVSTRIITSASRGGTSSASTTENDTGIRRRCGGGGNHASTRSWGGDGKRDSDAIDLDLDTKPIRGVQANIEAKWNKSAFVAEMLDIQALVTVQWS